jgi:formylmethanofuran dehydrogenase subunit C
MRSVYAQANIFGGKVVVVGNADSLLGRKIMGGMPVKANSASSAVHGAGH